MISWCREFWTAIPPRPRHIAAFSTLVLIAAWIDAIRPFNRDLSILYFLPLCYAGWYLQGRYRYFLYSILAIAILLAPLVLNPTFFVTGSSPRILNRIVGMLVGLMLLEVLHRLRVLTDQLEAANKSLESRVASRTLELQCANEALQAEIVERRHAQSQQMEMQQQLLQSQKMEVVGQFAGGIAHDFNNMLTVIVGHASLLLDQAPRGSEQQDSLEAIKNAGARAADLTRQLLVFSRHNVIQSRVVQLNELIRDTEKMLRPLIPENIDFEVRLSPQLSAVAIDPAQFSQVLVNLVINARDAMPAGGRLVIRTCMQRHHGALGDSEKAREREQYVLMEVMDTGCGMAAEVRERIFEPFFTTKSAGKGVGLGLSIVAGIVKQSRGLLDVSSIPGEGTRFQVFLPPSATAVTACTDEAQPAERPGDETILLVEDEVQLRRLAVSVLRHAGYRVVEASNGADACEKSRLFAGEIDLLLTDVVMPGMSGRQVFDQIKDSQPGMKVIYMSGYNDDAVLALGVMQETVHFLAKPFTPSVLIQKVGRVLYPQPNLPRSPIVSAPTIDKIARGGIPKVA